MMSVIRRRWWVVLITTVAALAVGGLALLVIPERYAATATLQAPIAAGSNQAAELTYVDRLMNTYTKLVDVPAVRTTVARALRVAKAPTMSVTVEPNTQLLQLTATAGSARFAQRAANAGAGALAAQAKLLSLPGSQVTQNAISAELTQLAAHISQLRAQLTGLPVGATQRSTLTQQLAGAQSNYQALVAQLAQLQVAAAEQSQPLAIVQLASLPTAPSSPKKTTILGLALVIGLLGGIGMAFVLERFVPRLYTVSAVEDAAESNVLAVIPRVTRREARSALWNGGSPAQEAFGVLAVHILAEAQTRTLRTILVTSRRPSEGKSTVAVNLAAELARSGHRVVAVDADMRSPSLGGSFGMANEFGLSDLLADPQMARSANATALPSAELPYLDVLAAGTEMVGPAQLLASKHLPIVVQELLASHEFVIFDAPPLVVSDPLSLARLSDLVLLVVGGDAVPDRDVQNAAGQLASIGAGHVSVVLNRWASSPDVDHYHQRVRT